MTAAMSLPGDDTFIRHVLEIRIGGRYQLDRKLGDGTFGRVYQGRDVETGQDVALKLEHYSTFPSLVPIEVDLYESLATKAGFPRVLWHGQQDDYSIMVLDLLGPNLEDLLSYCGGRFSLKTTLMLAEQLLTRFETFHAQGYLHRDVKPENFLMGTGRQGNTVYMTDLGLAAPRRTVEPITNFKDYESQNRHPILLGTCLFASINGHYGGARFCGDELESLGYMLIYFIKGRLPWQELCAKTTEEAYDQVRQMKQNTTASDLCSGLPVAFKAYMDYVQSLSGSDIPDYQRLRLRFRTLFQKEGFSYDNVFDWTLLEFQKLQTQIAERTKAKQTNRPQNDRKQRTLTRRKQKQAMPSKDERQVEV